MANAPADYATRRWNVTTGCSPVSAGCANCWARRFAQRHRGRLGYPSDDPFRPTCRPDRLDEPLRWRKPQTVAVCFMGDLFHDEIHEDHIIGVFKGMAEASIHRFLLLTKRPRRARVFFPLPREWNLSARLWLGVSVEDQRTADERIPILLDTPAAHRWVSHEPALGMVRFGRYLPPPNGWTGPTGRGPWLDWVVQGCESGSGRRPFDLCWARDTRDECEARGVPYYLKQLPKQGDFVRQGGGVFHAPTLDGRQHLDLPWEVNP